MDETITPEQRMLSLVNSAILNVTFRDAEDVRLARRQIEAAIRAAETAAVEAERARCAKEAAGTALREFYRLPFSQFALAEQVSAAAAKAINPDATPTTEAAHG